MTIRRLLAAAIGVIVLWTAPLAQSLPPGTQALTAQFSASCGATTCASWAMGSVPVVTLNITGTYSGTITFKGSSDGGNTYFTITVTDLSTGNPATTTTTTGQFAMPNSGLTHVQARMTTWASGGANVSAIRGFVAAKQLPFSSANPVPCASGGTGLTSYAVGDLIYASASPCTLSKLADVAAGSYLRSGGVTTAPLWSTTTLPNSATAGDLLHASASNVYSNLADVATGSVLISGGAGVAPAWSANPTLTSVVFSGGSVLNGATANVIEQRNGSNFQKSYIYKTFTDASNYERLKIGQDAGVSNTFIIGAEAAGTGVVRGIGLSGATLGWYIAGIGNAWNMNSSGHFVAGTDNTYDFGASAATRARTGYFGTSVVAPLYSSSASSVLSITSNVLTPTSTFAHVGAGLIKTITVPSACTPTCAIYLVPDAAYTYDATGNVVVPAGGGTAVVNKLMIFMWDGTKWTPSY